MRDTKREMILFSLYDRTGLQKHFEKLATEGWMLEDIGNYFIRYRRSKPRQVHFCVSYNYKASVFDPEPTEEEQEFREFCAHTGWEVAASNGKMLVFHNEREDPTPIETDPVMEVEAIHRAMMRSTIPAYAVCLLTVLLGLWLSVSQLVNDPIGFLSRPGGLFSLLGWLILTLLLGVELGGYFLWRRRAVKAAEQGVFSPTPNHFPLQAIGLGVFAIALVWYLINVFSQGTPLVKLVTAVMVGWTVLLLLGVNGTRVLLKRKGVSRGINRAATLAVDVVLAFVLLSAIVFGFTRAAGSGLLDDGRQSGDPPLSVADLTNVDMDGYRTWTTGSETILLGRYEVHQHVDWHRDDPDLTLPSLEYTVTEVKLPLLYDWCRDRLYHEDDKYGEEFGYHRYEVIDPAPWGTQEAWERVYNDGGRTNRFLLCYDSRVVVISFNFEWTPTPEQRAIVGEKLGK